MTLATRCPSCGTAFRVQPAQLSQKGGKVRCGKCATVFDGVAALNEPSAPSEANEPSPQLALFEASEPRSIADALVAKSGADPEFLQEEPETAPRRGIWAAGAAIAFVVLVFQGALLYRTELAVLFPAAREPLSAACRLVGCTVHLPRKPELMSIETSDLESDRRHEGVIVLNAVIRNRAQFAQEYPALELTLTDERDQPVLRRVLTPADYTQGMPGEGPSRGIAAGAEANLRLHLHAGSVRAVGYRLYLFYP